MKKFFAIALITLSIGTSAFANTTETVSRSITSSFKSDFKNATNVTWTSTNSYAKATFTIDAKKMEAFYNDKGEIIGTSTAVNQESLPEVAKNVISKKFADYIFKEAIQFDGVEENAIFVSLENEKEIAILKVSDQNQVTNYKRIKK